MIPITESIYLYSFISYLSFLLLYLDCLDFATVTDNFFIHFFGDKDVKELFIELSITLTAEKFLLLMAADVIHLLHILVRSLLL